MHLFDLGPFGLFVFLAAGMVIGVLAIWLVQKPVRLSRPWVLFLALVTVAQIIWLVGGAWRFMTRTGAALVGPVGEPVDYLQWGLAVLCVAATGVLAAMVGKRRRG